MVFASVVLSACCVVFGIAPAGAFTRRLHPLGANAPTTRRAPDVVALTTLPASVDLREYAMTPGDQGDVSSCVTWAIQYGMMGWYFNKAGWSGPPFAPICTYSQIHSPNQDDGSWPQDALAVGVQQGSDTRAHYSHSDSDWSALPSSADRSNAANYKITGYHVLFSGANQSGNKNAVKAALAAQQPVAITLAVRNGFDNMGGQTSEGAVDDDISSEVRGLHEVLAVGYDGSGVLIQNSWGPYWANGGFTKISWRVIQRDVSEADTIDGVTLGAPTVSVPAVALEAVGGTSNGAVLYSISWTGTPHTSGAITEYDAYSQKDGGPLKPVALAGPLDHDFHISVSLGHTYRIAVEAKADDVESALTYSAPFRPTKLQETDTHISYSGVWALANNARRTRALNAKATLVASGRRFSWVASVGPAGGSARIYVDGVAKATVSTYAGYTADQQVLWSYNLPKSGSHTIAVVNLATPGHSYVDVDGFVVSS